MPRRYKQGADGQPHPAFYGKLPEEFSKADTMRFMVETDLKLSGCVSADTLAALRAEGYDYKDGNLVPAGKEETMQEKVANTTPAAPLKLDVSVRVIEPVKNPMEWRDLVMMVEGISDNPNERLKRLKASRKDGFY